MLKKKIGIMLAAGTLVLGLASCAATSSPASHKPAVVQLHASWANAYSSVKEMVRNSDAIVQGTVGAVADSTAVDQIPYTDFAFHVTRWIKSKDSQPSEITIHQTGGKVDGQTEFVDDDPLLVSGANHILFLHEYAAGKYFIVGGPTGRLNVSDGKVTPFAGSIATDGLPTTVTSFATRVASIQAGTGN